MRIADYIRGKPLRLISPLPPDAVQAAINTHTRSVFKPFGKGVTGWARLGRIRLRYQSGFFQYTAKPVLVGRIENDMGRALLQLRYRAPLKVYGFLFLWLMLVPLGWSIVNQTLTEEPSPGGAALVVVLFALYMLMPLWTHWIGTLDAEDELGRLREFLRQHALAEELPDLRP
jgi:hypothetical protein